jgi:NitT/TauT family transport system substrate-binding protein
MSRLNVRLSGLLVAGLLMAACGPSSSPAPTAVPTKPAEAAKPAAPAAPAASPAAGAAAASPAAAAPAAAAKPASLTKVTMGNGAESAVTAPIWISIDNGIFAKYGIEPDLVTLTGGSQISQGLASGSVQIATGGLGALLDAEMSGAELKVIGSHYPWHFFQIYSQASIKTPQDLKGKTIGASDPGASSDWAIRQALSKYGMEANKDYNITYVGGTKERLLALDQKVVDAAIISPPNGLIAGKQGYNKVVDLVNDQIPFGYSGLAASQKFIKEKPELVEAFFKAWADALTLAKKDKKVATTVISKYTGAKEEDVLSEAYELSVARMKPLPYLDVELVKLMLNLSEKPQAKTVDPNTLFDNSYLKKVEDSGFLKTIGATQ